MAEALVAGELEAREPQALPRRSTPWGRSVLGAGLLAGAYYASARIGYALEFSGAVAAIVWLPVGVGIAGLYLGGLSLWPGVVIGDLLANDYTKLPLGSSLGQTCGNVLEVVVATLLLRRLVRRGSPLASPTGLGCMLVALAAGTAVSATIGLLSLRAGGVFMGSSFPNLWRTWWLGDACGALLVVPLAIAWWPLPHVSRERVKDRAPEIALLAVFVVAAGELATRSERPLTYLAFPALIWAALRFGAPGGSLAVMVVAGFTVWNTTHYDGPFVYHSISHSVLSTQLFIAVAALSTLCLAAVVSEREQIAERLGTFRGRLFEAADLERRRIERNLHDGAQQRLVALAVHLDLSSSQARDAPELAPQLFEDASEQLQLAIGELRELAHGMHPSLITRLGLADAIRSLASRSSVPVVVTELPDARLDDAVEANAYYVLAEAVTNAHRHAGASLILLSAGVAGDALRVEVADDGVGGASLAAGSGLRGLSERVEALGGSLTIQSPVGKGTRIIARLPTTAARQE